jgi:D-sedoheptulose 7-phosphate isomerase
MKEIKDLSNNNCPNEMQEHIKSYADRLSCALNLDAMHQIPILCDALIQAWKHGKAVYICGNGGSAGNAIHIANDWLYGSGVRNYGVGLRVEDLSANPAVLTCLANDVGYDQIFAEQIKVKARMGDVLIVLSGSGNSLNIINALEVGNTIGMETFAILAFSGGRCKELAKHPLHFNINDMQIAEDLQLIVAHICMQWLHSNPVKDLGH